MEFILRVQEHTAEEINLQQKLSFSGIDYLENSNDRYCKNFITIEADLNGATCLRAACNFYGWDKDKLEEECDELNKKKNYRVILDLNPCLILIPIPTNEMDLENSKEYYFIETIKFLNFYNADTIHFTQYSLIDNFNANDVGRLLKILFNPLVIKNFKKFYWEIDSRYLNSMQQTFNLVNNAMLRLNLSEPSVIYAKRFKIIYDDIQYELQNSSVREFRLVADD